MYESASQSDNADLTTRVTALVGHGRAGIVTDIDGTISPIVARPEAAIVLPRARWALEGFKEILTVVGVVTGRSVLDARKMVDVDGLTYIGNHGLETWHNGRAETLPEALPWVPRVATVLEEVARSLERTGREGVIIENKGATASLHYRLAADPDRTRLELLETLALHAVTSGLRIEEGRRVINLLPPLTITKGSAVTWLVREHALERIVFLGDDTTDAHAFEALDRLRRTEHLQTLGIAVVGPETPSSVWQLADAAVPTVDAVTELLCQVLERLEGGGIVECYDGVESPLRWE